MLIAIIIVVASLLLAGVAVTAPVWSEALSERSYQRKMRKASVPKREIGSENEEVKLSSFSNHILGEFLKIPKNHRPFSSEELVESLKALDVKFGISEVNRHFTVPEYSLSGNDYFTINCTYVDNYYTRRYSTKMRPHNCNFNEYQDMLKAIQEVQEAVKAQEKALAVSAVQPSLDAVQSLTDALRQETQIVNTVTKELC